MQKKLDLKFSEVSPSAMIIYACQKYAKHGHLCRHDPEAQFLMASLLDYCRELIEFCMSCKRR
jgi:hypothetical protein